MKPTDNAAAKFSTEDHKDFLSPNNASITVQSANTRATGPAATYNNMVSTNPESTLLVRIFLKRTRVASRKMMDVIKSKFRSLSARDMAARQDGTTAKIMDTQSVRELRRNTQRRYDDNANRHMVNVIAMYGFQKNWTRNLDTRTDSPPTLRKAAVR